MPQAYVAPKTTRRSRGWSTSCSSTTSQSSIVSIYAKINQSPPLAEPKGGYTNAYGSFTTTIPASVWLRSNLGLHIPSSGKRRVKKRDLDCGYDTPPDSPLSSFSLFPGSRRSPSISRTLLSDFEWGGPSAGPVTPSPPSPAGDDDCSTATKLHPVLKAVERASKLSCRTTCSTCQEPGSNFPRCPRCSEMWCSRACRLRGGNKHVCVTRKA